METWKELCDDAQVVAKSFAQVSSVVAEGTLLEWASEAINYLQKATNAVRRTLTIQCADLAADGSIATNAEVAALSRAEYVPVSGQPGIDVQIAPAEQFKALKRNNSVLYSNLGGAADTRRIYITRDVGKLWFYPFSGLTGAFEIYYVARCPRYSKSRGLLTTGDWANWDGNLTAKMASETPPMEFTAAEPQIIGFIAARIIETIPMWEHSLKATHDRLLAPFPNLYADAAHDVKADDPPMNLNSPPASGWL